MSKTRLDREHSVINVRSIKKRNLPYILFWIVYYAWVVAFTTWWTSQPGGIGVAFGVEFRNLVHITNMLSSVLCVCFFKKDKFVAASRVGVVAAIISLVLYITVPSPWMKTLFTILLGMSLGCVNISILIPFTFILNNTEKLLCVVVSHALSSVISLFLNQLPIGGSGEAALAVAVLVAASAAVLCFRCSDLASTSRHVMHGESVRAQAPNDSDADTVVSNISPEDLLVTNKNARPAAALTLLASTVGAILFLGTGKAAFNAYMFSTGYNISACYYIGGIAGCLIYALIFALMKKSIHMTLTIPFGCLALAFLYNALSGQAQYAGIIFGILLGAGTATGMSTVYYVLGVVGKKYNSMLYLRLSIGIIGICGGVSGVLLGNTISGTPQMIVAVSICSMIAVVLVLVYSPAISRVCFDENWAGDLSLDEITALKQAVEQSAKSDDSALSGTADTVDRVLSPKELKIALLLIEGETPREISRMLTLDAGEISYVISSIRDKISKGEYDSGIAAIAKKFKLTRREIDILRCLKEDMPNTAIAAQLFLSEETVRIHIRNLIRKLPVENRHEVAEWVVQHYASDITP